MGCHLSTKHDADNNPRIFKVSNVDDQWNELSAGKIEITDLDLILYQKGKEPIRRPLRSLRRYGFDAELFSFESGRRCPTGPGIYAFKCRRAEALFNLLQESIQKAGQEEHHTRNTDDGPGSRPGSLVVIQQGVDGSPVPGQYVTPVSRSDLQPVVQSPHHYVNGDVALGNGHSRSTLLLPANQLHEYVNTTVAVPSINNNLEHRSASVDMSNIQVNMNQSSHPTHVSRENSAGHVITYAILDLPPSKEELASQDKAHGTPCHAIIAHNGNAVTIDLASSQATYVNVPASDSSSISSHMKVPFVASTANIATGDLQLIEHRASIVSLGNGIRKGSLQPQLSREDQHSYANLDLLTTTNGQATPTTTVTTAVAVAKPFPEPRTRTKVNYIQLDLRSSTDNLSNGPVPPASPISLTSSNPESPSRRTESYATIDFHKTAALSNSANKRANDDGFRKTRHNSNIEELS